MINYSEIIYMELQNQYKKSEKRNTVSYYNRSTY